jgi:hypothetical protein
MSPIKEMIQKTLSLIKLVEKNNSRRESHLIFSPEFSPEEDMTKRNRTVYVFVRYYKIKS